MATFHIGLHFTHLLCISHSLLAVSASMNSILKASKNNFHKAGAPCPPPPPCLRMVQSNLDTFDLVQGDSNLRGTESLLFGHTFQFCLDEWNCKTACGTFHEFQLGSIKVFSTTNSDQQQQTANGEGSTELR